MTGKRLPDLAQAIPLGILATGFLDAWNLFRHLAFDVPLTNYEPVGRWLLHMMDGKFVHEHIRHAAEKPGELVAGWAGHYAIGIVFAVILVLGWGRSWLERPRPVPALIVGLVTCAIPFFIMQPAMGNGIAGHLTPDPWAARMKVIVSHIVFGFGLFAAGWLLSGLRARLRAGHDGRTDIA